MWRLAYARVCTDILTFDRLFDIPKKAKNAGYGNLDIIFDHSHAILSSMPPHTRRVMCSI